MQHETGVLLFYVSSHVPGRKDVDRMRLNIMSTSATNASYNIALNISYLYRIINVLVLDVIVTTAVEDAAADV